MASTITRSMLLAITILSVLVMQSQVTLIEGQQVNCFYIMGDSQFDNGNNNYLPFTSAKVNYYPYGIDYPGGVATGRFANGKNVPDYLAQSLGFSSPIPPYASYSGLFLSLRGYNYASGLAGILNETGQIGGQRFTFSDQLANHAAVVARISALRGAASASSYLNQCLYAVNIGSNDYLNNYLVPEFYTSSNVSTPDQFAQYLIGNLSRQLTTLYNLGARRVAVFSIGLLGCVPQELARYPTNGSPCVNFINGYVQLFNNRLTPLINSLNANLPGARFTMINVTSIALGGPQPSTIRFTNVSCCSTVSLTGLCIPFSTPCSDRSQYSFWDNFHVTSTVNQETAARAYSAALPTDAYPVDISHLVQM